MANCVRLQSLHPGFSATSRKTSPSLLTVGLRECMTGSTSVGRLNWDCMAEPPPEKLFVVCPFAKKKPPASPGMPFPGPVTASFPSALAQRTTRLLFRPTSLSHGIAPHQSVHAQALASTDVMADYSQNRPDEAVNGSCSKSSNFTAVTLCVTGHQTSSRSP